MARKHRRSEADIAAMQRALSDTPDKLLWNINQAADVLGMSVPFLRLEIARERIAAKKAGNRLMFTRESLLEYVRSLPRGVRSLPPSRRHLPTGPQPSAE